MTAMWLNLEETCLVPALQEAVQKLDGAEGEVILDFGAVRRIDSSALRAIEGFAGIADQKAIKVVLRGVNVDVYKVLKLVKLAPRFVFASCECVREATVSESCDAKSTTE
jgi:anti-anti-sigma regulatory factor